MWPCVHFDLRSVVLPVHPHGLHGEVVQGHGRHAGQWRSRVSVCNRIAIGVQVLRREHLLVLVGNQWAQHLSKQERFGSCEKVSGIKG